MLGSNESEVVAREYKFTADPVSEEVVAGLGRTTAEVRRPEGPDEGEQPRPLPGLVADGGSGGAVARGIAQRAF